MEIIVKQGEHRIDPTNPRATDPSYRMAVEAGKLRMRTGQLKFKNEREEKLYWDAVNSNPANVPGLPVFHPPLHDPKAGMPPSTVKYASPEEKWREKVKEIQRVIYWLFCETCNRITPHQLSPEESFCQKCGTFKPYRTL